MLKIIISGCNGRMGRVLTAMAAERPDCEIVAGFDVNNAQKDGYPVYASPAEFKGEADVVLDFSSPYGLSALLDFCVSRSIPAVLATTGYSPEQIAEVERASEKVALFRSANMSLGVNLLSDLIRRAVAVLGPGYDIEIVEKHHNRKKDAPSGTAIMLADAAKEASQKEMDYIYDRHSLYRPREKNEIGISSIRAGTIVGEHQVIFAGQDEVIELKHTSASREIFAVGAFRAGEFLSKQQRPGLYNMDDLIKNL